MLRESFPKPLRQRGTDNLTRCRFWRSVFSTLSLIAVRDQQTNPIALQIFAFEFA